MTAINIIKQTDRVHMITDGLVAGGSLMSKVITLPHLNLALACSGAAGAGIMIAAEANQATNYDDLKENIGELMRHCEREYPRLMRSKAEPDYEIYGAGISETIGPDFFFATSHKRRAGIKPYLAQTSPGDVQIQPCNAEITSEIFGIWEGTPSSALNPLVEGPRILEIQRKHLNSLYPDRIGGLCTVTTISCDGISQKVAKRWPLHLGWDLAA